MRKKAHRVTSNSLADELCRRFRLPGHQWVFAHCVTDESLVIRRDGQFVLVRQPQSVTLTLGNGRAVVIEKPGKPRVITHTDIAGMQGELHQASIAAEMAAQKMKSAADVLRLYTLNPRAALNGDLLARAEAGEPLAVKEAACLAVELTKVLTRLRGNKRTLEAVRAVAGEMFQWPTLLGASKEFSENREGVVEAVELGRRRVARTGGRADWREDAAGHVAQALLMHESKPRTWAGAKKLLLESYPDPVSVRELAALPVPPSKRDAKGLHRKGLHRGAILNLIKQRFDSRCQA